MGKRHRADGGRTCPSALRAAIRVVHLGHILENNGKLMALFGYECAKVLYLSAELFGQKAYFAERAQKLFLSEFSAAFPRI